MISHYQESNGEGQSHRQVLQFRIRSASPADININGSGNRVVGNFIGTSASGTLDRATGSTTKVGATVTYAAANKRAVLNL